MKVYKIELMVMNHENVSDKDIETILEDVRHLYPTVVSMESKEIGEWTNDHPLNKHAEWKPIYNELFKK